jgi:tRNA threonylcarbamoyl adenosine modification protein YjeE
MAEADQHITRPQLIPNLEAMQKIGRGLAARLDAGDILCLHGALGAGKSALSRAIISGLCRDIDDIPSPTFTLVQPYLAKAGFEVWHLDLYRLEREEEVLALGIEEAFFEACCLIEWPERITALLPDGAMHLYLGFSENDASRILDLSAPDALIQNNSHNNAQKKLASWLADIS